MRAAHEVNTITSVSSSHAHCRYVAALTRMRVAEVRTLAIRAQTGGAFMLTRRKFAAFAPCALCGNRRVCCDGGFGAGHGSCSDQRCESEDPVAKRRSNPRLYDHTRGSDHRAGCDGRAPYASGNRIGLCAGRRQRASGSRAGDPHAQGGRWIPNPAGDTARRRQACPARLARLSPQRVARIERQRNPGSAGPGFHFRLRALRFGGLKPAAARDASGGGSFNPGYGRHADVPTAPNYACIRPGSARTSSRNLSPRISKLRY